MTQPHAIRIHKFGGPEELKWEPVDVPSPGPGEALIEQTVAGLNFIDVYFRTGLYPLPSFPATLGNEGAGIVRAVGDGVSDVSVGAQDMRETPAESSEVPEQEIEQESITAGNEDIDAREENSDSAEPGEKKEPVINIDNLALNPDADETDAKPVKSNGSGALGENLAANSDPQKESTPTPSA